MNNQKTNHIYPIFDRMLGRADKEELLKQHGLMIWFTGLSGSGKSTIALCPPICLFRSLAVAPSR